MDWTLQVELPSHSVCLSNCFVLLLEKRLGFGPQTQKELTKSYMILH